MRPRRSNRRRLINSSVLVVLGVLAVSGCWGIGGFHGLLLMAYPKRIPVGYQAPTQERLDETRRRAEKLVEALNAWRAEHGSYPDALEVLAPTFPDGIPLPTTGFRIWDYKRPEPDHFVLDVFIGPIYEHMWWDSREGRWQVDM